jgi:hypothetical protein
VNLVRENTPRYLGHFTAVSLFMFLLLISSLVSGNFAFASTEERRFPQSIITASSTDTTPHALKLKAMQQGDAEPKRVSGFKIDLTNVVTAQINSQILVFVTDSSVKVLEAKVRTVSDQLIDLIPSTTTQANAFSLVNLPVGVYTLDIITQKGNAKAAYEGILVINQQPTTIINETTKQIINQEINQNSRVDIDTRIIFKEVTSKSKPEPRMCTQGMDVGSLACKAGITVEQYCAKYPQTEGCPEPESPICTPDGPPCPPCPEGVEAGWCADEDERQDFDCGDEGMEDDPRCKDGEPVNGSEDTGGSNPNGEEEDQNCGGVACTDDEKNDYTLTDKDYCSPCDRDPGAGDYTGPWLGGIPTSSDDGSDGEGNEGIVVDDLVDDSEPSEDSEDKEVEEELEEKEEEEEEEEELPEEVDGQVE